MRHPCYGCAYATPFGDIPTLTTRKKTTKTARMGISGVSRTGAIHYSFFTIHYSLFTERSVSPVT